MFKYKPQKGQEIGQEIESYVVMHIYLYEYKTNQYIYDGNEI